MRGLILLLLIALVSVSAIQVDVNVHIEKADHHVKQYHHAPTAVKPVAETPIATAVNHATDSGAETDSVGDIIGSAIDAIQDIPQLISRYIKEFGKKWSASELATRVRNVKNALNQIIQHNKNPKRNYDLALNQYSDLSDQEFKSKIANSNGVALSNGVTEMELDSMEDEEDSVEEEHSFDETPMVRPTDIDPVTGNSLSGADVDEAEFDAADSGLNWSSAGRTVAIRNQGTCGSCWAFAASDAVSAAVAIKSKTAPKLLSPQYLVDCNNKPDSSFLGSIKNNGCNGGYPAIVFHWLQDNQHVLESNYPYKGRVGSCRNVEKSGIKLSGYRQYRRNVDQALKELSISPVVVFVHASSGAFRNYRSGIITNNCSTDTDHVVLLVGYGSQNGVDYWIIKNSWGTRYGEKGYVRIVRGKNMCGVENWAIRPIV